MMSRKFILASSSPRRRDLLTQIGITPEIICPADIDETPISNELPKSYVLRMAQEKAHIIVKKHPKYLILAADTVVALGRRILPKAEDDNMVRQCLMQLSGRRHRVYTAIAVSYNQEIFSRTVTTMVQFKRLDMEEINRYLTCKEGIGKAGGYAIQGLAATFIPEIQGSYSNVVGLPLCETANLLKGIGYYGSKTVSVM